MRDSDQVVFKWAKEATEDLKKRREDKCGVGAPCNAQLQTRPSIGDNLIMGVEGFKVLMVDQLWGWIINEGESASQVFRFPIVISTSVPSADTSSQLRRDIKDIQASKFLASPMR